MTFPEPCNCGALDCPRCYPETWKENKLWMQWSESDSDLTFSQWKEKMQEEEDNWLIDRYLDTVEFI